MCQMRFWKTIGGIRRTLCLEIFRNVDNMIGLVTTKTISKHKHQIYNTRMPLPIYSSGATTFDQKQLGFKMMKVMKVYQLPSSH